MAKVDNAFLERVAARRPKMCPFHSDLTDFALMVNDPAKAISAMSGQASGPQSCRGDWEGGCNWKVQHLTKDYWDAKDAEYAERAQQRQQEQQAPVQPEAPVVDLFEDAPADEGHYPDAGDESAVGVGTVIEPAGPQQVAASTQWKKKRFPDAVPVVPLKRYADGPGVVSRDPQPQQPSDSPWKTETGRDIQKGQTYLMKTKDSTIPDKVTVRKLKPDSIIVDIHANGMTIPDEIMLDELKNYTVSFETPERDPAGEKVEQQYDNSTGVAPDGVPAIGEVTDLSDSGIQASNDFADLPEDNSGHLQWRDPSTGEPVEYSQYAANLREHVPEGLRYLAESPNKGSGMSRREMEMMMITAGRAFSRQEQAEFINEQGGARNRDKLDLSGTHYTEDMGTLPPMEQQFLLGT